MATSKAPIISSCIKVGAILGGAATRPSIFTSPISAATMVIPRIPIIMAPGTLRIERMAITTKPSAASRVSMFVKSPRVRYVAPLATIIPPLLRPIKPTNKPTPAPIAMRILRGILSIIQRRKRVTLIMTNSTPAIKTAPNATCQLYPISPTTVKVKKALRPMPGASPTGQLA